jgi:hypothetical protein
MKLRDHPLMNYRGLSNWPPCWLPRGDGIGPRVHGEVGVLTELTVYHRSRTATNRRSFFS